jgi:hypothetical protein
MDAKGRKPSDILEDWRRAEEARDGLQAGTDDWLAAERLILDLKAEYQDAIEARNDEAEELARSPGMPIEGDASA